jgi:hypothetical protein
MVFIGSNAGKLKETSGNDCIALRIESRLQMLKVVNLLKGYCAKHVS